jgi:hypothetical protein
MGGGRVFFLNICASGCWSWDSSVGVATGCRLDGQGLISGKSKIFLSSTASILALGPNQPPSPMSASA